MIILQVNELTKNLENIENGQWNVIVNQENAEELWVNFQL